jgi:FkbM family methyltransferase
MRRRRQRHAPVVAQRPLFLLCCCCFAARCFAEDAFTYVQMTPHNLAASYFEHGVEGQIADVFRVALAGAPAGEQVYDVGQNLGFFTLLAASLGAQVSSFDPQAQCIRHMREILTTKENAHLASRIAATNVGIGKPGWLRSPPGSCDGGYSAGAQRPVEMAAEVGDSSNIISVPLHSLLPPRERLRLLKVDTEGAEVPTLRDAAVLARAGRLDHLVVELLPRAWESHGDARAKGVAALEAMAAHAHTTLLLEDPTPFSFTHAAWTPPPGVRGPTYANFSMADLVDDRLRTQAGCNLWFAF